MNQTDDTNVTWGKTSWLALGAAAGQFIVAAVIYLLADDDQKIAAAPVLVTAASTLYALIKGRMDQATAKATPVAKIPAIPVAVAGSAPDELDDDTLDADDAPPEAQNLPTTDPSEIPPDEVDQPSVPAVGAVAPGEEFPS